MPAPSGGSSPSLDPPHRETNQPWTEPLDRPAVATPQPELPRPVVTLATLENVAAVNVDSLLDEVERAAGELLGRSEPESPTGDCPDFRDEPQGEAVNMGLSPSVEEETPEPVTPEDCPVLHVEPQGEIANMGLTPSAEEMATEPAPPLTGPFGELAMRVCGSMPCETTGTLMFAGLAAGATRALVERLGKALAAPLDCEVPVIDARRALPARINHLRETSRWVLAFGQTDSDEAMTMCRHCDGVYLVVPMGVDEAAVAQAAHRARLFGGTLLGAVAIEP